MRITLAFLILTSLLFRLWFALGYWGPKPLTHDATEYLELAKNYKEIGQLIHKPSRTLQIESYGRAPGYPLWLSLLLHIGPSLAWLRLAEVFLSLGCVYLFFLIARDQFHLRSGLAAMILALFYIPLISLIPSLLSENLWVLLILLSYWLLLRARPMSEVAAFLLLALATLVRPAAVFLLPLFCYWIYRKGTLRQAAILGGLYFLLLLPWNVQLFLQEERWSFVASEGGVTFWTGTHPKYSGEGDLSVNPPVQADYRKLLTRYKHLTAAQREKVYTGEAFQNVWNYPAQYAWIQVKKLVLWLFPFGPSVWQTSLFHRITGIAFYLPVFLLALIGFRSLPSDAQIFFGGVVVSFTIMILIFFPQERFRIATLDPIFLLIAAHVLSDRLKSLIALRPLRLK